MDEKLDRRKFAKLSSLAVSGLVTGRPVGAKRATAQDSDKTDQRLLRLGLNALARAPEMNYFADGHRGAAMVSAYLLCNDNHLDERARVRITKLIDVNWASSELCKPFPAGDPEPGRVNEIGIALADGGDG